MRILEAIRERHRRRRRDLEACAYLGEWGVICAEFGPWAYAANIGAPVEADLRTIAYLAVWHDVAGHDLAADEDFVDEAISVAYNAFEFYLDAHPESIRP